MSRELPVLIAGAGLAGLSTAYHLGDLPHRVVEREREVGGLCRSIRRDGFTFDYTGHLLHLRRPEIRDLVTSLLPGLALERIDRRSGIYSHGVFTEYPFQVNTHGLPKSVVRECVMGFAEALADGKEAGEDPSFLAWALATFGAGICRNFLVPYNEKLYCTDLDEMTADWVSWSIPRPTWPDVVRGALGTNRRVFGYNPQFLYPAAAGIDHLPRALGARLRSVEVGVELERIRLREHSARLSSGEWICYRRLVSSLPLDHLIAITEDAPEEIRCHAERLRAVSVLNLNLGFDAPCSVPHQWIYFPESRFPFYRIGVYSNLSPASTPVGCSSFYVEISHPAGSRPDAAALIEESASALREIGLVPRSARLLTTAPISIPVAYVIHDRARREALHRILPHLEVYDVRSTGRYGSWEYAAMEDALWQGREAAAWCRGSSFDA